MEISKQNYELLCPECQKKFINIIKLIKSKKANLLSHLIFTKIKIELNPQKIKVTKPLMYAYFNCKNYEFGLFYRDSINAVAGIWNNQSKDEIFPISLDVLNEFNQKTKKLSLFNNVHLEEPVENFEEPPEQVYPAPFEPQPVREVSNLITPEVVNGGALVATTSDEKQVDNLMQQTYLMLAQQQQQLVGLGTKFSQLQTTEIANNQKNKKNWLILIIIIVSVCTIGLGIGIWQIIMNVSPSYHQQQINISNFGGDYTSNKVIVENTSHQQLKLAVKNIVNLNPQLLLALEDQNIIFTTPDILVPDGIYHTIRINIDASQTTNFVGTTFVLMSLRAKKIDISQFSQDISQNGVVETNGVTPDAILHALLKSKIVSDSIAKTFYNALEDPNIKLLITAGTLINDNQPHLLTLTVNTDNSQNYLGSPQLIISCLLKP